jgi:hypothetical protein
MGEKIQGWDEIKGEAEPRVVAATGWRVVDYRRSTQVENKAGRGSDMTRVLTVA